MTVLKFIIKNKIINQYKISKIKNISHSYVNDIVMYLKDLNIVTKKNQFYYLNDPFKLLQLIDFERPFNRINNTQIRLQTNNIIESERILKQLCDDYNVKYSLTMFSGLKRYFEYYITYPMVHTYIDDFKILNKMPKGEGPIPVIFIEPDYKFILKDSKKINNYMICDEAQILIDLFSSGIGRDAAYNYLNVLKNE